MAGRDAPGLLRPSSTTGVETYREPVVLERTDVAQQGFDRQYRTAYEAAAASEGFAKPRPIGDSGNPKDAIGDLKPPLHLVPPALILYASQAMKNGAEKYGPYNWREKKVRAHVYYAALLRHLAAWFDGEDVAEDSGVHHLGHAAAGLAILLDAMATGNLIDDRPVPGAAARLVGDFTEQAA